VGYIDNFLFLDNPDNFVVTCPLFRALREVCQPPHGFAFPHPMSSPAIKNLFPFFSLVGRIDTGPLSINLIEYTETISRSRIDSTDR